MPDDLWKPAMLGDEVELLTGYPFKSSQYTDDATAIKLLRGDNVVQGRLRWENVKRWPADKVDGLTPYLLEDGDVVLAMDRPWIEAGLKYAAIDTHDLPALLVQRVARLRGGSTLDTRFLRYLIGSADFTHHVLAVQTGTAVPHISGAQIKAFKFRRPPLDEQRAIADILGSLDDKIELNRRMNRTLEAMARAIFKSWFIDFDPVRAKADGHPPPGLDPATAALFPAAFQDSPLGPIPQGWRVGTLGEVADNPRHSVKPEQIDPASAYIALDHMPRRSIALAEWDLAESVTSGKYRFNRGDILFGKLRPYFHKVGVAPVDGVCSTDILVVVPKADDWFGFVLAHISSDEFIRYTDAASTGTKMPRTNWDVSARRTSSEDTINRPGEAQLWASSAANSARQRSGRNCSSSPTGVSPMRASTSRR